MAHPSRKRQCRYEGPINARAACPACDISGNNGTVLQLPMPITIKDLPPGAWTGPQGFKELAAAVFGVS
eukprot:10460378-Lingulodinium_polyedra.AAC.1